MHKNKTDILDYYILFFDDWFNIMNKIENDYKTLNKFAKYVKMHSIPEIIQQYDPSIWYSQFKNDGSIKNKHLELFSLYSKQIEMLNNF